MTVDQKYLKINKESWNNKVKFHVESDFYNMDGFLKGETSLNSIELDILGDVTGKEILHLQCHFGQDTLSFGRMGAKPTGVDISDKAIDKARELSAEMGIDASFICCDIYDLEQHLDKQFDVVFTSYGTIGWLPDMNRWAQIVSKFLKPGGQFVFVEFHPVVWMFDDNFEKIQYDYFNTGVIQETESGTYAEKEADLTQEYIMWNHSMSDVINNLIKHDVIIESIQEFDYSPYDCFNKTIKVADRKFRIAHLDKKIPMVYAVEGRKN